MKAFGAFPFFVILLVGLPGCKRQNEFVQPPPPKVTVAEPISREVTTYATFTGRLEAIDTVEIRARVSGFLESVDFGPSEIVSKGALLFTIESAPYEAVRDAAIAEREQLEAAQGLAKVTLDRMQAAIDAGAASDLELIEAQSQLDAADASLLAAAAAIRTADINLGYTQIAAPMSGRISRNLVSIGNLVGAGEATHLTTIVVDDPIYAYFTINERELLQYLADRPDPSLSQRPKRTVYLELSDGSAYEHAGEADFADNRVDTLTGSLQVRAVFPNPEGKLFPGLFARVKTPSDTGERFLVPGVALQRDLAGSFVLHVDAEGKVVRRGVTVGERVGTLRIVTDGLEGNERVIVAGLQRARPGVTVDAQLEQPDPAGAARDPSDATESNTPAGGGA